MQKILVIQTAFIGDAILATGILEKLHKTYPNARIDYMIRKGNESLFINHPFINKLIIWNKKDGKYKSLITLLKQIRNTKYDLLVNVQRFAATGFLTAFSKAKQTIGFDKNPFSVLFTTRVKHIIGDKNNFIHEVQRNQKLLESITQGEAENPRLYPSAIDDNSVEKLKQKPYVCIAPASVWFTKQFPVHKWVELIRALDKELIIYLIGAPSDKAMCTEIITQAKTNNVFDLSGELSLLESTSLIRDAQNNYVNDSAPMHLASSVNANVTAIYCSTLPSFGFGPLSTQSKVIEVEQMLKCRPCGLHGKKACPLKHFDCANYISIQNIIQ